MFFDEEDEIFGGTPRSKFFDIIYNANRNLVEFEIEKMVERYKAMEVLLEKYDEEFHLHVNDYIIQNPDSIDSEKNDFYIGFVGDVLSNNE